MTSRFVRLWADVVGAIGYGILGLGVVAGLGFLVVGFPDRVADLAPSPALRWAGRVVGAMLIAMVGVMVGGLLVTVGHLVHAFLDQRRILRAIHHRLAAPPIEEPRLERAVADRLRRRL